MIDLERSVVLANMGLVKQAEPLARAAAERLLESVGPSHPDYARVLISWAYIHEQRGRLDRAVSVAREALTILEGVPDEAFDSLRARAAGRLARCLALTGELEQAERFARMALQLTPMQHPQLAEAWTELGGTLRVLGRIDDAEQAYQEASASYDDAGEAWPCKLMRELAELACARGQWQAAEQLATRSLAEREHNECIDLFERGVDLRCLGDALAGQQRLPEAESSYRQALAHFETAGRFFNVEVAFTLHALAEVHVLQHNRHAAERCFQRTIVLKQRLFGTDHHEVGLSLAGLALLYVACRREADAQALLRRALPTVQRLPAEHPVRECVQGWAHALA